MILLLRLASGSGRTAIARQVLVVAGIAVGAALLLVATGIATLSRSELSISGSGGVACDAAGVCLEFNEPGSTGSINLDYLVQPGLRAGVVAGFVLCVVPLLVFVATASRVAARRRDERLAALRLGGASQGQVRSLAMVDALVGGVAGTVIGTALYVTARGIVLAVDDGQAAAIARGTTPPLLLGLGVLVLLLAGLASGSLLTLRAVQVGPLGVRRRSPRRAPRPWGLLLLLPLAVLPLVERGDPFEKARHAPLLFACLVLAMLGLVGSGAWLTSAIGRVVATRSGRPAVLLAGRRLEDDPRAQARAMSAVVLVVFAATLGLVALADSLAVSGDRDGEFLRRGYGAAGFGMLLSLAVGAAGLLLTTTESVLERRRTMAALHATGVPLATLRRTLLAQVALPVLPGSLLAMGAGLVLGWVTFGSDRVTSGVALMSLLLPLVATFAAVVMTSLTLPLLRSTVDLERLRTP